MRLPRGRASRTVVVLLLLFGAVTLGMIAWQLGYEYGVAQR
jgi:hypothetical protein